MLGRLVPVVKRLQHCQVIGRGVSQTVHCSAGALLLLYIDCIACVVSL